MSTGFFIYAAPCPTHSGKELNLLRCGIRYFVGLVGDIPPYGGDQLTSYDSLKIERTLLGLPGKGVKEIRTNTLSLNLQPRRIKRDLSSF